MSGSSPTTSGAARRRATSMPASVSSARTAARRATPKILLGASRMGIAAPSFAIEFSQGRERAFRKEGSEPLFRATSREESCCAELQMLRCLCSAAARLGPV